MDIELTFEVELKCRKQRKLAPNFRNKSQIQFLNFILKNFSKKWCYIALEKMVTPGTHLELIRHIP